MIFLRRKCECVVKYENDQDCDLGGFFYRLKNYKLVR